MAEQITCRRIREEPAPGIGKCELVDRVRPWSMREEDRFLDKRLRGVAPSSEPREWYGHEPSPFAGFRRSCPH